MEVVDIDTNTNKYVEEMVTYTKDGKTFLKVKKVNYE